MTDQSDIIGSFMALIGGIFGDILARIIYKGGTLHLWYLTFPFFFFPLSFVSFIIYLTGVIKKNDSPDSAIDAWSWWLLILPPIWYYFVKNIVEAEQTEILNLFFYIFIFLLARINRKNYRCRNFEYQDKPFDSVSEASSSFTKIASRSKSILGVPAPTSSDYTKYEFGSSPDSGYVKPEQARGDFSYPFKQVGVSLLAMSIGSLVFDMINMLQVFVNMIPDFPFFPLFLFRWLFSLMLFPFQIWDYFACVKLLQTGISLAISHVILNMLDTINNKEYNKLCTEKADTLPIPKYFPIPDLLNSKYFAGGGFFSNDVKDWQVVIPILLALIIRYSHSLFLRIPLLNQFSGCPLNDDILEM